MVTAHTYLEVWACTLWRGIDKLQDPQQERLVLLLQRESKPVDDPSPGIVRHSKLLREEEMVVSVVSKDQH